MPMMTSSSRRRCKWMGSCCFLLSTAPSTASAFVLPTVHHRPQLQQLLGIGLSASSSDTQQESSETEIPKEPRRRRRPINRQRKKGGYQNQNKGPFHLHRELQNIKQKRHPDAARRAEDRLNMALAQMTEHKQEKNGSITQGPDEVSFNIVIMAYAQSSRYDSTAPHRAEGLLRRMQELSSEGHHQLRPTVFAYNAVMEAWTKSRSKRAESSVLRLFDELQQQEHLVANTYTYNMVLAVHSKSSHPQSIERAEQIVADMKRLSSEGMTTVTPDRNTFDMLLTAYARHGLAEKAEELVDNLWQSYRNGNENLKPNMVWMNCVINAWSKSGFPEAGARADAQLNKMQSMYELGQGGCRPDTSTYNQVMNAHAQCGNTSRVEELLLDLEHRYNVTGEPDLEPDTITYSTAIKSYMNMPNDREAAGKACTMLQRMEDLFAAGRQNVQPNLVTYNTVLNILAKSGSREGLQKATDLLRSMQDKATASRNDKMQPNSFSYAELIHGFSRSGLRDAGYRSEELLYEMEQLPYSRLVGVQLTVLYNSVIKSWAKSGDTAAPRRAEALLALLEQKYYNGDARACPDCVTFLSISDAYAKSRIPDAPQRCEALLRRMDKLLEKTPGRAAAKKRLRPNRALYNSILNALAKSCQQGAARRAESLLRLMQDAEDEACHPDIVTYSTVIDCHTKSGEPADRAEELLQLVEVSYRSGNVLLKPNSVFYSAVLQAWAKSATSQGAKKAERLLRRIQPHALVYNAVMDAIARSGDVDAGQRAEELLKEMIALYQGGDENMMPSRRSFNAVMLAYRQDPGGAVKAEQLLRRMEELAEAGVYNVGPDVVAYNCAIGAIADSTEPGAADRAQALLDRMVELYERGKWDTRPDEITYSSVIEAWLKRNDEKGSAMAHMMLQKFLDLVESTKTSGEPPLQTDKVWDVINSYKTGEEVEEVNGADSVDSVLEEMASEFDDIDW